MDLEKVINSNNLCILINKSSTYLKPYTGSYSAIDISISDPSSYIDYTWKVHNNLCGNDHFHIILESHNLSMTTTDLPAWKQIRSTDNNLKTYAIENPNSTVLIKHFTETIGIANETIPKISPLNRCNALWFNKSAK